MQSAEKHYAVNPVLIVGAGPTGLCLACDLARRDITFRIIDKEKETFRGSRGKGIQPRTLEVLEDLGLIDAILAHGSPFPVFRTYAGDKLLAERSLFQLLGMEPPVTTTAVPYPQPWLIPQWRTEAILRQKLTETGHCVEQGVEVTGFTQDDQEVRVSLQHADGTVEELTAAFVIGADGGRSFIRKFLGVGFEGTTIEEERTLLADVQATGIDRDHCHIFTPDGNIKKRITLWPLPCTTHFQLIATMAAEEVPPLTLPSLQAILEERSGRKDIQLHEPAWSSLYRVNVRMAERFRIGRILLAGDAAHVHSSAGGQGLNTGVQDAGNLGWKLALVLKGAPATLLDTYEAERLTIAAGILGLSSRLHARQFENASGGTIKEDKSAQDIFQLQLHYRNGPLSVHCLGADRRIQAGDRAPDALYEDMTGTEGRLFHLLQGPHFTLLVIGEEHLDIVMDINLRHESMVQAFLVIRPTEPFYEEPISITSTERLANACILDHKGTITENYDLHQISNGMILIRPDGYIGVMAEPDPAVMENYYRIFDHTL